MNLDDIDIIIKRGCYKCRYSWWPRGKGLTKRCPKCQTWLGPAREDENTASENAGKGANTT